jgi:hypothetical protein
MLSIPSQYFAGFKSREHARPFAAELAQALGVQVLESPKIVIVSTEGKTAVM